jgi:branched-subunit amino acid aminotransferase/4-amino-4-deoxychorismate lyase
MDHFLCFNGEFIKEQDFLLPGNNRAFYFGDSLFESMHAYSTLIPLFKLHFDRLLQGMEVLGYEQPASFTSASISATITRLLNRNKQFKSTRVRLTVFRNPGGLYLPTNNSVSYLVQASTLDFDRLSHKLPSMIVDVFPNQIKCAGELSPFKTGNALLYVMAARYAKLNRLHDSIIVNQHGRFVELSSSNIFGIREDTLVTPPLQEGCVAGVMRNFIVHQLAPKAGYRVDIKPVTQKDFAEFEEVFATNAVSGIRNIVGIGNRRFYSTRYRSLQQQLEKLLF